MSTRATPALQRYCAVAGRAIPSTISRDAVKERPMDILTWSLIQQLQPELQRSGLSRGRRDTPEGGGAQCGAGLTLVRMIQDVKELAAELRRKAFAHAKDFAE